VHAKKAHKWATSFYASELKKPKGERLSADAVSKIVKKEYDGHVDEIEAEAALGNIVDSLTEDGAEEGAEHSVNVGEMDAV
jgi:hypothetical protein